MAAPVLTPPPATPTERLALSRGLSQLLVELAIALNSHGMYPDDHPLLRRSADALCARLETLLRSRPRVSVGVAHRQLVVEGVATESENPVLSGLAQRLHRRRVGAIVLERGVSGGDLAALLRAIADEDRPLFEEGEELGWPHAALYALSYRHLRLSEEPDEEAPDTSHAARLWLALACTALSRPDDAGAAAVHPAEVARALESPGAAAYDQVIVGYLRQLAGELSQGGREVAEVRARISRFVTSLSPATLRRLVAGGGDEAQRGRFLLDAAHGFAADAVVEIVRAAADDQQTVSHALLRLLGKLAAHAGEASAPDGTGTGPASRALREQVSALVQGWSLPDPNPDAYTRVLEVVSREARPGRVAAGPDAAPEPLRIVQMSLELGLAGPRLEAALRAMESEGRLADVLPLLADHRAAGGVADVLWARLASPEPLRALLARGAAAVPALDSLAARLGATLAPPLLDVLADSEVSTVRRGAYDGLVRLGRSAAPEIVRRLDADVPWYVHRNLLSLLREVGGLAADVECTRFLRHADVRVRREAVKLLLGCDAWRTRALSAALADSDAQVQQLALLEAQHGCPPSVALLLLGRLDEGGLAAEARVLAVRALRHAPQPPVLEGLLRLALPRRGWFGRRRLAPCSPELGAALEVLAAHWAAEPRVAALLRRVRAARDPALRRLLPTSDPTP